LKFEPPILSNFEQISAAEEYKTLSEHEKCDIILRNGPKAVSTARNTRNYLKAGKVWVSRTPGGEVIIKAALLYRYAVVGILEFSPSTGSLLPKGYHDVSFKVSVSLSAVRKKVKTIVNGLELAEVAEYREPERNFAIPLVYEGKIVAHLKVHYDGEHIVPDYPVMQEIRDTTTEVIRRFIGEWLFSFAFGGLLLTSLYLRRLPNYSFDDFTVIYTLFVFLVILKGLNKKGFVRYVASRFERGRFIPQKLVVLTALLSIFVTNDVALLTVVPLTLALNIRDVDRLIILEVLTANSASALSPFGNPQNIFIYYHYNVYPLEFVGEIWPFVATTFGVIILLSYFGKHDANTTKLPVVAKYKKEAILYLGFFVVFVLSVLRFLPLWVGVGIVVYVILFDKESLKIDYFLLATFGVFFGFTDNLREMIPIVLHTSKEIFFYASGLSQVISNVPATLFLSDFALNWKPLLWGVSVGGFGTLIASLASLISYRLYKEQFEDSRRFLVRFHLYNYALLFVGVVAYLLFG